MNVLRKARKTVVGATVLMLGAGLLAAGTPGTAEPAQADQAHRPGKPGNPVTINVLSDVQGDLDDFGRVLDAYASLPRADHMVVNGDLVPGGKPDEYRAFFDVLRDHRHPDATFTIGNHEFDSASTSAQNVARFLRFTGMPRVYHAEKVRGVPLIHLGSLQNPGEWAVGHQATLGQEQLNWLDAQLDRYSKRKPVLVFGHHPLPRSVSGTVGEGRQDYYDLDYAESEQLLQILGDHPNVLFFSGHTHYNLERSDWMNRVTTPGGAEQGFLAVNTGALQTEWGPNPGGPNQGEWSGSPEHKQGLRLSITGNRVVVTSLDFEAGEVIRRVAVDMRGVAVDMRGDRPAANAPPRTRSQ